MGKLKWQMLGIATLMSVTAKAGYYNIDLKTAGQVTANTGYAEAAELANKSQEEKKRKRQEKIAKYTTVVQATQEVYKYAMQNIKDFGYESQCYKSIGTQAMRISMKIPQCYESMTDGGFMGVAVSAKTMTDIATETMGLVQFFVNIVNNGKIDSPFKGENSKLNKWLDKQFSYKPKNDGLNFIDRYQRIMLAHEVLAKLERINWQLDEILYLCEYQRNVLGVLREIDYESWTYIVGSADVADDIIKNWDRLV